MLFTVIATLTVAALLVRTFYVDAARDAVNAPEVSEDAARWIHELDASLETGLKSVDVERRRVSVFVRGQGKSTFLPAKAFTDALSLFEAVSKVAPAPLDSEASRTILENCLTSLGRA